MADGQPLSHFFARREFQHGMRLWTAEGKSPRLHADADPGDPAVPIQKHRVKGIPHEHHMDGVAGGKPESLRRFRLSHEAKKPQPEGVGPSDGERGEARKNQFHRTASCKKLLEIWRGVRRFVIHARPPGEEPIPRASA